MADETSAEKKAPPNEYRGGHYFHFERDGDGYRATCAACQWTGEAKASRSAAERDWQRYHGTDKKGTPRFT